MYTVFIQGFDRNRSPKALNQIVAKSSNLITMADVVRRDDLLEHLNFFFLI